MKHGRFGGHEVVWDIEVPFALDCGGLTAMKRYGGYRWTIWDYVDLATQLRPLWWSAMDYCCEPVRFHLFGVKSAAVSKLKDRPRVASVDSMAWSSAARWEAFATKQPKGKAFLTGKMQQWVIAQRERSIPSRQLTLL
jgi:hypothetical protein